MYGQLVGWVRARAVGGLGRARAFRTALREILSWRAISRDRARSRVDNSLDITFRSSRTTDFPIQDDLGLHRPSAQKAADFYELILDRRRASGLVITGNRAMEEWLSIFDDPILGNSAPDRLVNATKQIVIEGATCRELQSPHRKLPGRAQVIDSPTAT